MKQVKTFTWYSSASVSGVTDRVAEMATEWLQERPSCTILSQSTSAYEYNGYDTFILTLIVELPDQPAPDPDGRICR